MTRSTSASSEPRRVHHKDFSQASLLFNLKSGRGEEEGEGAADREVEIDGEG